MRTFTASLNMASVVMRTSAEKMKVQIGSIIPRFG